VDPIEILQSLGGGELVDQLARSLILVAEEVRETRKKGAVTLTLNVLPSPGGDDVVIISEDLKRKPPARDPRGAIFFAIGDGLLHRSDPRQTEFQVRTADSGKSELRVVEHQTPQVREASQ